jgi:hypothetical protein
MELDHPQRNVSKDANIKVAELYINDIQLRDKTIQKWKLPNIFVWGMEQCILDTNAGKQLS